MSSVCSNGLKTIQTKQIDIFNFVSRFPRMQGEYWIPVTLHPNLVIILHEQLLHLLLQIGQNNSEEGLFFLFQ